MPVDYAAVTQAAFLDELEKIAFKRKLLRSVAETRPSPGKSRFGKVAIRAAKLVKKGAGGSVGNLVDFSATDWQGSTDKPAEAPKGPNDQPSREDGREHQEVKITGKSGPANFLLAPAAVNYPEEHGNY